MGGTLEVASELSKGSRFGFAIPLPAVQSIAVEIRKPGRHVIGLSPGQPRYRILVAEDQPDSRMLLQEILESAGFEVRVAETGERALNLFRSWHPHLVWMDMRMPVMDGYEATRRIKSSPAGINTPVLALTASAFEEDRAEVLAVGCDGFLRKPLNVEEMFGAMAEHLGVRYEYADDSEAGGNTAAALDQDALEAVKPQLCAALRHAALLLDAQQARVAIAGIAEQTPELASALNRLVDEYRFDMLLTLCEEPLPARLATP
jgi:CheY-like chemotaxis protein